MPLNLRLFAGKSHSFKHVKFIVDRPGSLAPALAPEARFGKVCNFPLQVIPHYRFLRSLENRLLQKRHSKKLRLLMLCATRWVERMTPSPSSSNSSLPRHSRWRESVTVMPWFFFRLSRLRHL